MLSNHSILLHNKRMPLHDPYQTPQSNVDTFAGENFADLKLVSFTDRIGRLRYFAYSLGWALLLLLCLVLIALAVGVVGSYQAMPSTSLGVIIVMTLFYSGLAAGEFVFAVRRLHDLNRSGWLALLLFVPFLTVIVCLVLWSVPGTKGSNRFGLQPPPNGGGVIFIGLIVPIVVVIGGLLLL